MGYSLFAAIEVGSSEMSMKIYELSKKNGIHELDYVRQSIEIGAETYSYGRLSHTTINDICMVLMGFKRTMKSYGINKYIAIATSAIREAVNSVMVLDRIRLATGITVDILSNSEKRFLYYKAIALKGNEFKETIKKSTTILDVGAGSIQISLYNKNSLISTQNIRLGFLRVMEVIADFNQQPNSNNQLISEYINNDLNTYNDLFLEGVSLKNIIAVGDNINEMARLFLEDVKSDYLSKSDFDETYYRMLNMSNESIAHKLSISLDQAELLLPTAMIYKKMFEITNAEKMWFPRVQLNDGIAVDYAEKSVDISPSHDFTADIILAARNLASKYRADTSHTNHVEMVTLKIFDSMKKVHGMGERERLLAQLAAILHNCGAFINMNEVPINSYNIIMSTEIIGLSHREREMVASLIKYITYELPKYSELPVNLEEESYIAIAKITAILRLANAMDKSHLQKFNNITVKTNDNIMVIEADTLADISLEKGLFNKDSEFFMEIYGIKPKLKQMKKY